MAPFAWPWCACPCTTSSGRCMPIGPASRPDPRNAQIPSGSPTMRVRDGRVVEEHDALVASGDGLEPQLERLDLRRGLAVDLAESGLAEVGDLRAGKAAHEALRADDADVDVAELEDRVAAVEHDDSAALELRRRPRRAGRSDGRGSRARRSPGRSGHDTHPRALRPARAGRGSSGLLRAGSGRSPPRRLRTPRVSRSRSGSTAWTSPAAATRSVGVIER